VRPAVLLAPGILLRLADPGDPDFGETGVPVASRSLGSAAPTPSEE
jgi:hypothetical protein